MILAFRAYLGRRATKATKDRRANKDLRERTVPPSGRYFPERAGVLELHASYTREQIMLAFGKGTLEAPFAHREGVLHLPERRVDARLVTINK